MIYNEAIGIIELGNIKIKCLIFKINSDNSSEILSTSICDSAGIHNGVVINLSKASNVIRSCISIAEKNAEVSLKRINVITEQPEFLCTKLSKNRKINGSKIHNDDITFLLKEAKKQVTLNDNTQSIIHIFNHNYIVDGKIFAEEPIDVYANYLSHEMTFVTMPKNNIKNISQVFIDCDIEVDRFISSTFVLAIQLLNNNDLQFGSILIDMGFEKTSLGIFKNLALIHSMTLPIGVNHIIKDVSKVCLLNLDESKNIVKKIDFSFEDNKDVFDKNELLINSYFKNTNFRKISKTLLLNVIQDRLNEIFYALKKQMILSGFDPKLGNNLYITGGGSKFVNLFKYCSKIFNSDVKKIDPTQSAEKFSEQEDKFMACLGALKLIKDGWETEAIPQSKSRDSDKKNFFSKIFSNLT
jgi:cell division protein FtsA